MNADVNIKQKAQNTKLYTELFDLLHLAQREVQGLMEMDSLHKFVTSDLFRIAMEGMYSL